MKKLFLNEKEVSERFSQKYRLEDDILCRIDVEIIPHYGWLPCFSLVCGSRGMIPPHNNISNLGYILHHFMQLFDIREDGEMLSSFTNKKVRLVYDAQELYSGRCVGIGHPWRDKFILFSDLMKVTSTEV